MNDDIVYVTDEEELLTFLGNIDSMEEALLIAIINGFKIDSKDKRGSSYRVNNNVFEFSLMKLNPPAYQFQQFLVRIDKNGNIEIEERDIYCKGLKNCEKL